MKKCKDEYVCELKSHLDFDTTHTILDKVDPGYGADLIRINEREVRLLFANDGYVRIVSDSPITLWIKPG